MRIRLLLTRIVPLALAFVLALAPAAGAVNNDGRGYYGATDDKVVVTAGFIVIVSFVVLVFVLSRLQAHLERRKEARKAGEAAGSLLRGGW
jgi:hypothetical protein